VKAIGGSVYCKLRVQSPFVLTTSAPRRLLVVLVTVPLQIVNHCSSVSLYVLVYCGDI